LKNIPFLIFSPTPDLASPLLPSPSWLGPLLGGPAAFPPPLSRLLGLGLARRWPTPAPLLLSSALACSRTGLLLGAFPSRACCSTRAALLGLPRASLARASARPTRSDTARRLFLPHYTPGPTRQPPPSLSFSSPARPSPFLSLPAAGASVTGKPPRPFGKRPISPAPLPHMQQLLTYKARIERLPSPLFLCSRLATPRHRQSPSPAPQSTSPTRR